MYLFFVQTLAVMGQAFIGRKTLSQPLLRSVRLEGKTISVTNNVSIKPKQPVFNAVSLALTRGRFSVVRKCVNRSTKKEVLVPFV